MVHKTSCNRYSKCHTVNESKAYMWIKNPILEGEKKLVKMVKIPHMWGLISHYLVLNERSYLCPFYLYPQSFLKDDILNTDLISLISWICSYRMIVLFPIIRTNKNVWRPQTHKSPSKMNHSGRKRKASCTSLYWAESKSFWNKRKTIIITWVAAGINQDFPIKATIGFSILTPVMILQVSYSEWYHEI